ncbi:MAG: tyrosine-type recombinase/integrase [Planctomycetota bacterium]
MLSEVFGDRVEIGLSFKEAVPLYVGVARTRKSAKTMAAEEPRFGVMLRERWAALPLGDVRTRDLSGFAQKLLKKGPRGKPCSGSTVNRYLAALSALFRWAVNEGLVADNPVRGVETFSEKGTAREVFLEADEARALITACDPQFRPIVEFALGTGCRRDEIVSLCWRDVHWKRAEVYIRAQNAKTKKGRPVPLSAQLVNWLQQERKRQASRRISGEDRVFHPGTDSGWSWKDIRRAFCRAKSACDGMPEWKRETLRFHDLRHTYASLAVQHGVPLDTLSRIMGHSSLQTTMRYAHLRAENRELAARTVGELLASPRNNACPS